MTPVVVFFDMALINGGCDAGHSCEPLDIIAYGCEFREFLAVQLEVSVVNRVEAYKCRK